MTDASNESDDRAPREITGILIDPDGPGALIQIQSDHQSICTALDARNTEAYFFRKSAAIAWMPAEGGEWNLAARGFLEALDRPTLIGAVSGPVLIVGEDGEGDVCDVTDDLVEAARRYGILPRD